MNQLDKSFGEIILILLGPGPSILTVEEYPVSPAFKFNLQRTKLHLTVHIHSYTLTCIYVPT